MNFISNKLKGRIIEILGSNSKFISLMGMSRVSFYNKIDGKQEFTQSEIVKACKILQIEPEEIYLYFFQVQ